MGEQRKQANKIVRNCECKPEDFEWSVNVPYPALCVLMPLGSEFNYRRDGDGKCVLVNGTQPRPSDDSCRGDDELWYERTAYRLIPYSSCEGGDRLDHGPSHQCPGIKGHGFFFWFFVLIVPCALASLVGYWIYRRSGMARGYVLCMSST